MKCPCNCHDQEWRKIPELAGITGEEAKRYEEHADCGLCFIELFEEAQDLNAAATEAMQEVK